MSIEEDIRWKQRFHNYQKKFEHLKEGIALTHSRELSDLEKQGLIQGFEYTFELAWKTLKDYLVHVGEEVKYPRQTIKKGFEYELLEDGECWLEMLSKRNLMAHAYDEEQMNRAYALIRSSFFEQLRAFYKLFKEKLHEDQ